MDHLSGNLSDFALPDILQILALCQKTGVLSLEDTDYAGKIMVERGRITYASSSRCESLADRLSREQTGQNGHQRFPGAASAAGVGTLTDVEWIAGQHFRAVVAWLVTREKGRFWIDVNQESITYPPGEFRLKDGLDIAEVLLEAAKESDEEDRVEETDETESDGDEVNHLFAPGHAGAVTEPVDPALLNQVHSDLLYSYLAELRSVSFEAEASLLVMRFASEIAGRGVLFWAHENELRGLGQFGFKSELNRNVDEEVRSLRIAIPNNSILSQVVMTGKPYIGPMLEDAWRTTLLNRLGIEIRDCSGFVISISCGVRVRFIVYGDDHAGAREITGVNELMILADQAGLVLEKLRLEQMLISH
ncbi:MAG TPA: DUF4388 domain-containing protein [Blastocatellia bacterium]|nr:DUF4388 domain-containing protein [Blastocatellia bacterium]